jgi:hypothetical protein
MCVHNNRHRFLTFRPAEAGVNLITGNSTVGILGYGDVDIFAEPIDSGQKIQIRLQNVAYIPTFYTSLMSYDRAMAKGIYWDGQNGTLITNRYSFCKVMRRHGQWVIEYNSTKDLPIEDYYDEGDDNDNNNRDDPEGYVVRSAGNIGLENNA